MKVSEIDYAFPNNSTQRMVLSQTSSVYDPLGLMVPFSVQFKNFMGELVSQVNI